MALESLPRVEKVERRRLALEVDYETVGPLKRLLDELEAEVEEEVYQERVSFRVAIPMEGVEGLTDRLTGMTRGKARIELEGDPPDG